MEDNIFDKARTWWDVASNGVIVGLVIILVANLTGGDPAGATEVIDGVDIVIDTGDAIWDQVALWITGLAATGRGIFLAFKKWINRK